MSFSLPADAPLLLAFGDLLDPRKQRNQLHPLIDIIAIIIMSVICGAEDFVSVYRWAKNRIGWLHSIGLCLNGIPSHDTINRVFRLLDPKLFQACFMQWVKEIGTVVKGVIAIDGKTLCNSGNKSKKTNPLHIVHAFATENQLLLGELATEDKSNEITAIPELLKMLTIKGCVITIDAMGCQKKIVEQIRSQEGDYVIAVKSNQGTLHAEIDNFFVQAFDVTPAESECDFSSSTEKNRGRIEERQVWTCSSDWLPGKLQKDWVGLKTLVCVKSIRTQNEKTTEKRRYFISSLVSGAKNLGKIVRDHWGVENRLHWHLDVSFREDSCKIRTDHAAENFSLARKMALNLLKEEKSLKDDVVKAKKDLAVCNNEYLLKVLGIDL